MGSEMCIRDRSWAETRDLQISVCEGPLEGWMGACQVWTLCESHSSCSGKLGQLELELELELELGSWLDGREGHSISFSAATVSQARGKLPRTGNVSPPTTNWQHSPPLRRQGSPELPGPVREGAAAARSAATSGLGRPLGPPICISLPQTCFFPQAPLCSSNCRATFSRLCRPCLASTISTSVPTQLLQIDSARPRNSKPCAPAHHTLRGSGPEAGPRPRRERWSSREPGRDQRGVLSPLQVRG